MRRCQPLIFSSVVLSACARLSAPRSPLFGRVLRATCELFAEALFFASVIQVHVATSSPALYLHQRRFSILKINCGYQSTQPLCGRDRLDSSDRARVAPESFLNMSLRDLR